MTNHPIFAGFPMSPETGAFLSITVVLVILGLCLFSVAAVTTRWGSALAISLIVFALGDVLIEGAVRSFGRDHPAWGAVVALSAMLLLLTGITAFNLRFRKGKWIALSAFTTLVTMLVIIQFMP